MGLFSKKKEPQKVILPEESKCCRCGRKIENGKEFVYIDNKVYCAECYQAKRAGIFGVPCAD